jgi:hypothetical protein
LLVVLAACAVEPATNTPDDPQLLEATLHFDASASP